MGIAISAGAGLLLGLGLMIWGLRERSKRHSAEMAAEISKTEAKQFRELADHNHEIAGKLRAEIRRINTQLTSVRGRLNETRSRLVECKDPKAIMDWLDSESEEITI